MDWNTITRIEVEALGESQLRELTINVLKAQAKIDWSKLNRRMFELRELPTHEKMERLSLEGLYYRFPPPPRPHRSWQEVWLFRFGVLQTIEHEPTQHFLNYTTTHTYKPDAVLEGGKILLEIKGSFHNIGDARKMVSIAEQHPDKRILFVLQEAGTELPYTKPKKDGSRMTMETWLEANGFAYTYLRELHNYLRSTEYLELVKEAQRATNSTPFEAQLRSVA
ncbi:hypothetical protein P5E67_00675 [Vibrio parahaemolyticus]|nr:hypothetical protein [Vibrio parahaemolyticus]